MYTNVATNYRALRQLVLSVLKSSTKVYSENNSQFDLDLSRIIGVFSFIALYIIYLFYLAIFHLVANYNK